MYSIVILFFLSISLYAQTKLQDLFVLPLYEKQISFSIDKIADKSKYNVDLLTTKQNFRLGNNLFILIYKSKRYIYFHHSDIRDFKNESIPNFDRKQLKNVKSNMVLVDRTKGRCFMFVFNNEKFGSINEKYPKYIIDFGSYDGERIKDIYELNPTNLYYPLAKYRFYYRTLFEKVRDGDSYLELGYKDLLEINLFETYHYENDICYLKERYTNIKEREISHIDEMTYEDLLNFYSIIEPTLKDIPEAQYSVDKVSCLY